MPILAVHPGIPISRGASVLLVVGGVGTTQTVQFFAHVSSGTDMWAPASLHLDSEEEEGGGGRKKEEVTTSSENKLSVLLRHFFYFTLSSVSRGGEHAPAAGPLTARHAPLMCWLPLIYSYLSGEWPSEVWLPSNTTPSTICPPVSPLTATERLRVLACFIFFSLFLFFFPTRQTCCSPLLVLNKNSWTGRGFKNCFRGMKFENWQHVLWVTCANTVNEWHQIQFQWHADIVFIPAKRTCLLLIKQMCASSPSVNNFLPSERENLRRWKWPLI